MRRAIAAERRGVVDAEAVDIFEDAVFVVVVVVLCETKQGRLRRTIGTR